MSKSRGPLRVSADEAGQKLLQFLRRRLGPLPQALVHRWVRSGQIRINGGRVKAFDRVGAGDEIRLPPFAEGCAGQVADPASSSAGPLSPASPACARPGPQEPLPLPPLVASTPDLFVFCKPAGLPVHPGTGHEDSLTTRLARHFADAPFLPTPAHRLDKDTSGLLLVARNYATLRALHEALARRQGLGKEYLAWVRGLAPWLNPAGNPVLLCERLAKGTDSAGFERMRRISGPGQEPAGFAGPAASPAARATLAREAEPGEARLLVRCLEQRQGCSLVHLRLLTGRTHQIRVQLAGQGLPVLGDPKYTPRGQGGAGRKSRPEPLYLHACRLLLYLPVETAQPALPETPIRPDHPVQSPHCFESLPLWTGDRAVNVLPPAFSPNL